MPVVRNRGIATGSADGNHYRAIATASVGARELVVVRAGKDPGASSVAHSHDREEVVHVLSGRAEALVGEEELDVYEGDTLIIAAGTLHRVSNPGPDPFECILAKPAGIRFFSGSGEELPIPEWML